MNSIMRSLILVLIVALHFSAVGCGPRNLEVDPEYTQSNVGQQYEDNSEQTGLDGLSFNVINQANISNLKQTDYWNIPGAEIFEWKNASNQLAIGLSSEILIYDRESGGSNQIASIPVEDLTTITASRIGNKLLWADSRNSVYVYDDTERSSQPLPIIIEPAAVLELAISGDESLIAVSTSDSRIHILHSSDYKDQYLITSSDMVFDLEFSPDIQYLFGVEKSNFGGHKWDIITTDILQSFTWEESASPELTSVSLSRDWRQLSWVASEVVQLMDAQTGELGEILLHEDDVGPTAWSGSGDILATSSIEQSGRGYTPVVYFWDPMTGEVLYKITIENPVIAMKFSTSGDELAILTYEGQLTFWSIEDQDYD